MYYHTRGVLTSAEVIDALIVMTFRSLARHVTVVVNLYGYRQLAK